MHEKKIADLQDEYDRLVASRARIIAIYNRSQDGSREKHQAVRGLDNLGVEIVRVERELNFYIEPL